MSEERKTQKSRPDLDKTDSACLYTDEHVGKVENTPVVPKMTRRG